MSDKLLKSITFPNLTDKYLIGDTSLSVSGAGADSKTVGDALAEIAEDIQDITTELEDYAKIDGSYSNLTAGNAEQLISNVRANDKTPYLFRTSGGSVDIGDREYVNGIVGGTVAWNQLAHEFDSAGWSTNNSNSTVAFSDGIATVTIAVQSSNIYLRQPTSIASILKDHVYLAVFEANPSQDTSVRFQVSGWAENALEHSALANTWTSCANIVKGTESGVGERLGVIYTNAGGIMSVNETVQLRNCNIFDLTQMFGSTIADYIYSLERSTAGAGVAWFRKLFPKPYYAYNAGELMSVSGVSAHNMTGFNQWDEEWEVGKINTFTGANQSGSDRIRSKNYIHILPSTTYYFKAPNSLYFCWYDADENFIGTTPSDGRNTTKTTPPNAFYLRFMVDPAYGTTYNNDICINLSWDGERNGEYEPYVKHSYALDDSLTLRGIPKLDSSNNLYYDGDTYESDGTVTRRYGIVDLGTLTWVYDSSGERFYTNPAISDMVTGIPNTEPFDWAICQKYTNAEHVGSGNLTVDKTISTGTSSSKSTGVILVKDSTYTDAATFKTAMSGVYLVYELAEPTEETADPYNGTQIVDDFGTEEYVIDDDVFAIPVGHDTDYPIDLRSKLEMAPNSPEGNGDYIVRQTNGMNEYVPLVIEDALPTIPSTAGSYKLTVTVTEGSDPVLSWEAE